MTTEADVGLDDDVVDDDDDNEIDDPGRTCETVAAARPVENTA